ncbi:MAG: hypothetical protein WKF40_02760 [Thermoleophilaceae bacterium]
MGVGEDQHAVSLPEPAERMLDLELGIEPPSGPKPVRGGPETVALPEPALGSAARRELAAAVGAST